MRWGLIWTGLAALFIVAIVGWQIAVNNNGVWLVALFPIAAVPAGAIVLAGRGE
jgi:hypothetical protein